MILALKVSTVVLRRASPAGLFFQRIDSSIKCIISSTTSPVLFSDGKLYMLAIKIIIQATTLKHFFKLFIFITSYVLSFSASAHFQMLYTPDLLRDKGGAITFKMPFTHPAVSGHVMAVEKPQAFYMLKKGKKTDLLDSIIGIEWASSVDKGPAYQADVKLRGLGDYVFIVQPTPYYEAAEDIYIQQLTKTIINVGNLPTDWNHDLGLSAEIVPLSKPYAIYEGGVFSAVVKANGHPVPFAPIEVEYINYVPDMKNNRFAVQANITPPADTFVSQTIYADANGTFHFSLLKAGQWGFAALGVGTQKTHQGKTLSQDAVIWVQARELP